MNEIRVQQALAAATETKALEIGDGAIVRAGKMFAEMFPGTTAIIIADTNTYRVAGETVKEMLAGSGISQLEPFIIDDPKLYAEFSYVELIDEALKDNDAIPVAVGSGTINDLVKLSSHRNGRRYMNISTAASMDGYTAYGASITYQGAKQTLDCPAPLAVLADSAIIAHAPESMTASGYADLTAKITAGADWILADALGVEPIAPLAWDIVQNGLEEALSDPKELFEGDAKKIEPLIEGLMLGGFAMQASRSSRPASGAEHQFSHLWDMEHHKFNGKSPSHGFKVSIGSLASTALYERLLSYPMDKLDIDRACALWPDIDTAKATALTLFEGTDFPTIGAIETEAKYVSAGELRTQLETLQMNWPEISARLRKQLIPFETLQKRLRSAGAPINPEDIGISRERLRNSFIRAQHIRRRFTILDVAVRIGMLDTWLDEIFGQGGVWEISAEKTSRDKQPSAHQIAS